MRVVFVVGLAACWAAPVPRPVVATSPATPVARCLREQPMPVAHWLEAEVNASVVRVCSVHESDVNYGDTDRVCIGVTEAGAVVEATASRFTPVIDGGTAHMVDGHVFACANDGRCQSLGPKLAAVVGKPESVTVSDDGALLTSDAANGVWNVAADRLLAFEIPGDVPVPYTHGRFAFVSGMVEGSWRPCAGPCTVSRIYKRDGTLIAGDIAPETGVLALPRDRLAIMREDALAIYDANRATLAKSIAVLPAGYERAFADLPDRESADADPMVLLPDGRLAVVTRSKTALAIAFVDLEQGVVVRHVDVPVCTR